MKSQIRARIYITGFSCHPRDITAALGVEANASWTVGQQIGRSLRRHEQNGWQLDSALPGEDIEAHLLSLLERLPERTVERLRSVATGWDFQFALIIEMADEAPPFNLTGETIRRIAILGASLDVDMYVTESDTTELQVE